MNGWIDGWLNGWIKRMEREIGRGKKREKEQPHWNYIYWIIPASFWEKILSCYRENGPNVAKLIMWLMSCHLEQSNRAKQAWVTTVEKNFFFFPFLLSATSLSHQDLFSVRVRAIPPALSSCVTSFKESRKMTDTPAVEAPRELPSFWPRCARICLSSPHLSIWLMSRWSGSCDGS